MLTWIKVVFPEPAMPMVRITVGFDGDDMLSPPLRKLPMGKRMDGPIYSALK